MIGNLDFYVRLTQEYLSKQMIVEFFCQKYMDLFKYDDYRYDSIFFSPLNGIFTACECYDPEVKPEEETAIRIGEATLRKEVAAHLATLKKLVE